MSLLTTSHRGIEIRYACHVVTADFYAHFDLPLGESGGSGFQREVRIDMAPRPQPGKNSVSGSSKDEVLRFARTKIDEYLDAGR